MVFLKKRLKLLDFYIGYCSMFLRPKPDYVLILPWNLKDEIVEQQSFVREWGGQFVVPIPHLQVIP